MRTIEQNFKKNPHTARFLQTFHSAAYGLPSDVDDNAAERELAAQDDDLLASIPVEAPAYQPSIKQALFIADLTRDITQMDAATGEQALAYTRGMAENEKWTAEKVRTWIDHLIIKRDALRKEALRKVASTATAPVTVADGRYAVPALNGDLQFFKVKNGRKAGFVFLDIQASDDWHPIRNVARIQAVLALIAADPHAAMVRYGQEIGECGRCGRTLTSEYRKLGIGPVCIEK